LLFAGVAVNVVLIAVAGFVVMVACSLWAVTSYRRMTGSTTGRTAATGRGSGKNQDAARDRRAGTQAGSGLMGRLEARWRHRQQGDRLSLAARCRPSHLGMAAAGRVRRVHDFSCR
jgi:hypothetical protein